MARLAHTARLPTSQWRRLPDFLIIGAQRAGTTTLYRYLAAHPEVFPPLNKEVNYFAQHHRTGEAWYRAHFPLQHPARSARRLTFEASPNYLFYPHAPSWVAQAIPHARIIVLLREPVSRAVSHYHMARALGVETMSFADAVAAEPYRLEGELDRLRSDPHYQPMNYLAYSYLARGHYAEQLERWIAQFPRDQFLILKSEDLYRDSQSVVLETERFLGIRPWQPRLSGSYGIAAPRPPGWKDSRQLYEKLWPHFQESNTRLSHLLSRVGLGPPELHDAPWAEIYDKALGRKEPLDSI